MSPKSASQTFTSSLQSYFGETDTHTEFRIYTETKALYPTKQHVFLTHPIDLSGFLASQGHPSAVCEGEQGGFKQLRLQNVRGNISEVAVKDVLVDGVFAFVHKDTAFEVFHTSWGGGRFSAYQFVFDGADETAGKALVKEIFEWSSALKDEIWVYSQGSWFKDSALFKAIQLAEWDDIVLEPKLVRLNITWKRGLLLLGPPGNGKTQTIQVLLKDAIAAGIACLYVKSFKSQNGAEFGIRSIFELARQQAPCILVLEDLDAMVSPALRSFFLNELDGLERNDGILTIATTNHPDKIDDAILRRPSRFDQKYTFGLPTVELRQRYALKWLGKINQLNAVDFGDTDDLELTKEIAAGTEEWSFAFLKELFVSFLLRSASDRSLASGGGEDDEGQEPEEKETAREVMLGQVRLLAEQVSRGGLPIGSEEATSGRPAMFQAPWGMGMIPVDMFEGSDV